MAKELYKGQVEKLGITYEAKIEEGALKIEVASDLSKLVDAAAEQIPGESMAEKFIVGLVKDSLKAI